MSNTLSEEEIEKLAGKCADEHYQRGLDGSTDKEGILFGFIKGYKAALQFESIINKEWISVKEPPEDIGFVLVNILRIDGDADVEKVYWDGEDFYKNSYKKSEKVNNEYWIISHWQPLPEKI